MRYVERFDDMSARGRLTLIQQDDGDIVVGLIPSSREEFEQKGMMQSAEFCTIGAGGGQSPRTLQALRALMDAIDQDNRELPQQRA